jgi:hypothetical protein
VRLHDYYARRADTDNPEVHPLAGTIDAWWPETSLFLDLTRPILEASIHGVMVLRSRVSVGSHGLPVRAS